MRRITFILTMMVITTMATAQEIKLNVVKEGTLTVKHPEFFRDRVPWNKINLDFNQYNGNELNINYGK